MRRPSRSVQSIAIKLGISHDITFAGQVLYHLVRGRRISHIHRLNSPRGRQPTTSPDGVQFISLGKTASGTTIAGIGIVTVPSDGQRLAVDPMEPPTTSVASQLRLDGVQQLFHGGSAQAAAHGRLAGQSVARWSGDPIAVLACPGGWTIV